jgi:2-polyprenyl-6-methoxyphenol hydroxylase-like FAD-dependent oxidoreductase
MTFPPVVPVLVVGAGPVGLLLAIEIALAGGKKGFRPILLERRQTPDLSLKAAGLGAIAAEALERRGLGPALEAEHRLAMAPFAAMSTGVDGDAVKRPGGHFSGLALIDQRLQRDPERHMRAIPQAALERMLTARASELGVEIHRGVTVEGFEQDDEGVSVQTSAGPLRASYLVGCDGGRSQVRKLAGFAFPGTEPTLTGYQALVDLDAPEKLGKGWTRTSMGFVRPMPGGRVLVAEFAPPQAPRDAPITAAEFEAVLQRVSGTDVRVRSLTMASRWTDHARQAASYRLGRIFLAGDAAHVHSPFGGQGLNLGLVDATNLGFKLVAALASEQASAVACEREREALLDSYTDERHPVGARVLENTRAQVALMRPDPLTSALRTIVGDLMKSTEGNRYIGEMLMGVDVRYDLGDDDPRVGTLVKNESIPLADGTQAPLFTLLARGGGLFVSSSEQAIPPTRQPIRQVHARDGSSLLVRPDGCVAWTSAASGSFEQALARWFGA